MENIQVVTPDFVNVHITKSDLDVGAPVERRFKKGITVSEFKHVSAHKTPTVSSDKWQFIHSSVHNVWAAIRRPAARWRSDGGLKVTPKLPFFFQTKLELVTGGNANTMKLKLFDNKNNFVGDIDNNDALLGSYPIDDGMRIHVEDKFVLLSDVGASDSAERFRLSEEEYEKKGDTVRSFLQRNRLGKYNEEDMVKMKEQQQKELEEEASLAASVLVGARCEVRVPAQGVRRATVRYNGPLEGARGLWIGVQYDEPRGKNDGEVNGKRYFTCPPKYGGFVKPGYVAVGDFPEEELDLDDEI